MPLDLSGAPRFLDSPITTGSGTGNLIDMGAFEATDSTVPPRRIYVSASAAPDGDGASWETAWRDLFDAINLACGCPDLVDEIWVTSDRFPEAGDARANQSFHVPARVRVMGGFLGTESAAEERSPARRTTLDGYDVAYHVVDARNTPRPGVLDGFNITRGGGPTQYSEDGPGVMAANGRLEMIRCTISGNDTWLRGGGVFALGASLRLIDCRVSFNSTDCRGGGVYGGTIFASGTTFLNNSAANCNGGNLADLNGVFVNCRIEGGFSDDWGGGVVSSGATFLNCHFRGGYGDNGGGMLAFCTGPLINCTFVVTSLDAYRSHVPLYESTCPMYNCTVVALGRAGQDVPLISSSGVMSNCIVWTAQPPAGPLVASGRAVRNSCIRGWTAGGPGNISADPMFANLAAEDLRLSSGSPCIDAGTNLDLPFDIRDLDGDGDTSEPLPLDISLAIRRADIPSLPDTGVGESPIVDMGAYEARCPGDVDGDGAAGLADLAVLLTNFGRDDALGVDGDLTGDGTVDLTDLATLLAVFGGSC